MLKLKKKYTVTKQRRSFWRFWQAFLFPFEKKLSDERTNKPCRRKKNSVKARLLILPCYHEPFIFLVSEKKDSDEDLEELDLDEKEELEDKTSSSTSKKSSKKSQPNPSTAGGSSKQLHGNLDNNKDADYAWAEGLFEDYASGMIENSNKIAIFLSILEETIKAGDRLLLFSQSLLTLNLLESFLQRTKVSLHTTSPQNTTHLFSYFHKHIFLLRSSAVLQIFLPFF